jgi:hypothetical protein
MTTTKSKKLTTSNSPTSNKTLNILVRALRLMFRPTRNKAEFHISLFLASCLNTNFRPR